MFCVRGKYFVFLMVNMIFIDSNTIKSKITSVSTYDINLLEIKQCLGNTPNSYSSNH